MRMTPDDRRPPSVLREVILALGMPLHSFFTSWRRLLTTVFSALTRSGSAARGAAMRWAGQWRLALRALRDPATASETEHRRAAALGLRAFAAGLLAAGGVSLAAGGPWRAVLALVVIESLWAVARWIIIAASLRGSRTAARTPSGIPFAAGLIPYALALDPALRVAALLASWWLTVRGLRATGRSRRDARFAGAWAFGGQLGVAALGWLVRGGLALVLGSG